MSLRTNKKGIVFTVLSIVLAIFFTLIFSARIEKPIDHKSILIESRVTVLNSYLEDFFAYSKAAGSIAGYAGLQGVIQDVYNRSAYNPDFEEQYINCTWSGNLTSNRTCPGMENKTIIRYLDRIRDIANANLNLNSNYIIHNITVTQTTDLFAIDLILNLTMNIIDEFANLSDTRIVQSRVSIEGQQDPLYLLNGTYNQSIKKTPLRKKEGDWNHTDLSRLYYNHEYRNYKEGISFINRIKGNFTPNKFGIESLVNHTAPGIVITANDSMVDYLYWLGAKFSCKSPVRVIEINNSAIIAPTTPAFQLDEVHRLSFNVSNTDTDFTCPQT